MYLKRVRLIEPAQTLGCGLLGSSKQMVGVRCLKQQPDSGGLCRAIVTEECLHITLQTRFEILVSRPLCKLLCRHVEPQVIRPCLTCRDK